MKTLLESAVRTFRQSDHITNINAGEWVALRDERGLELRGIRGPRRCVLCQSDGS